MKVNSQTVFPADLIADLRVGRKIETSSQGWFQLVSIDQVTFTSVTIEPFDSNEMGQYYTNAIGLIQETKHYGTYPEALVWLPRLEMYGAWDASHEELHVFPGQTWTNMKSNLVPFIEAQWGSYKGKDKIKHITLKRPSKYPDAFDFVSYNIPEEAEKIEFDQCFEFLAKHEQAILRHPGCSSLSDTYTALAKVYYVIGINNTDKENEWREKCKTIFGYHPENRFHHEKETAEICSWISEDFGIRIFRKLLDKDKKSPEYAGGADLLSALFNDRPSVVSPILKLAETPNYTHTILRCLETSKRWALTVINDELAAKLKKNQVALNAIGDLIVRLRKMILSAPEGTYTPKVIHSVRTQNVSDRVQKGWEHIQKKEYSLAEELVRSALAEYPEDAQALFLDARLCWLSSGSIEAGIQRAQENLTKATKFDSPAIARLHNLIGCGFDELLKNEAAILAFEQAAELEPKEPIYASNLAEMHWKMENKDTAAKYAHKAHSLGSKFEIVETILKESKKPSEKRWQDLIQKWKESGLSDNEFCTLHNLNFSAFDHWKRKLR
ncbi:IS66 family insertion sequence element accessory protein TnpA [Leptospira santarosai]|uniref:IS66 family insertion sequence element accessory protein TnpA n=1 Tax=Leptospira santarosai TaxID=28183 RepID=UPI00077314B0|nr:hypothetical protein [Leptospira santarosai]